MNQTESVPEGIWQAIHPEDRDRYYQQRQQAIAQRQAYAISYRVLAADGNYYWREEQALPVENGVQDRQTTITTQPQLGKRAPTEAAQQRFQDLVNGLEDAIVWESDLATTKFTFVSQSAEGILGYPVEQWLNQPEFWQNLIHPEDREWVVQSCHQETLEGRDRCCEYRCVAADGRVVWLRDRVYFGRQQGQTKLRGLMLDISDRKASEEAIKARAEELTYLTTVLAQTNITLEKRNQELDQFAYVTSHDLKAPLRAIANLSEWIEEDLSDKLTADTRHQMNLLRGRVHRMEALINGLLQYSRVGRLETPKSQVSVGDLLAEIVDSLAPPETFSIEIAPMPTIFTERLPLEQVFTNLISNAIKYHPRQDGRVKIFVQKYPSNYEFAVADDGDGIAPEYHEKVFGIFQTLSPRDKTESTGIGLAIVKKIVEQQGGTIRLESQPGQGATFYFTWKK